MSAFNGEFLERWPVRFDEIRGKRIEGGRGKRNLRIREYLYMSTTGRRSNRDDCGTRTSQDLPPGGVLDAIAEVGVRVRREIGGRN